MGRKGAKNRRSRLHSESADDPLRELLPKAGLRVQDVLSDGNCLFRAFASQYSGDEGKFHCIHATIFRIERHDEFRQGCCDFMQEDDPEFFKSFMDDTLLEDYVSNMRKDGTWGTQLEIVSLCKKFSVNCVIFRPDGLHYNIECDESDPNSNETRILMISHHDEEHFNQVCFREKGRILTSFSELELLLTKIDPEHQQTVRLSKREQRNRKRKPPAIIVSESHKLINL